MANEWKSIFLRYRDYVLYQEGVDYIECHVFTDDEWYLIQAAIQEHEAKNKEAVA